MNALHLACIDILVGIENELREMQLWASQEPSPEALASTEPFAIDSLTFPQWLQFIFIPRLRWLIEMQCALPSVSGVKPMAEEYFRVLSLNSHLLIKHLEKMDNLLSNQ
jgi:uncharacterized protein YqcC (DUF446 family)